MVPCAALTGMRLTMAQHPDGFWNQPGKHGGVLVPARSGAKTAWAGALPPFQFRLLCEQPKLFVNSRSPRRRSSDPSKALAHTPAPCHGFGTGPLFPGSRWRKGPLGLAEHSAFAEVFSQNTELSFKDHHHNAGLTELSRLWIEHFENGDQVKSAEKDGIVQTPVVQELLHLVLR